MTALQLIAFILVAFSAGYAINAVRSVRKEVLTLAKALESAQARIAALEKKTASIVAE